MAVTSLVFNFDGSGMIDLTPEKGTHQAVFSPDNKYLVDTWSTVYEAPVAALHDPSRLERNLLLTIMSQTKPYFSLS